MKIVIIDDEVQARKTLRLLLHRISKEINIVAEIESVKEAKSSLPNLDFDLILLDIELIDGSGFDILENMTNRSAHVIFTTAFDQYAIEAFKNNAVDYLMKPIDLDDLKRALKKCKTRAVPNYNDLIKTMKEEIQGVKITLNSTNQVEVIHSCDIIYIQAEGSYCNIYLKNDAQVTCTKSLKHFGKMLSTQDFYQINRHDLINLEYLANYKKEKGTLTMTNSHQLTVSRRRKSEFLGRLMNM